MVTRFVVGNKGVKSNYVNVIHRRLQCTKQTGLVTSQCFMFPAKDTLTGQHSPSHPQALIFNPALVNHILTEFGEVCITDGRTMKKRG